MAAFRGFRNHYRAQMPLAEMLSKDLKDAVRCLLFRLKNGGRLPRVVTYPDYPSKRTSIAAIAKNLHFRLTNKLNKKAAIILAFDDQTVKAAPDQPLLVHAQEIRCLNLHCLDIRKTRVEEIHQSVFGYGTFIDPLQHRGQALEKSDENAKHDGHYIDCPCADVKPGSIYQRVIDNRTEDGTALDYRLVVMGELLPIVYCKYKKWDQRFTNEVVRSSLHNPEDFFTFEELDRIRAFAREMKTDFCELDILRDKSDGKIFVIDVNTTPYGPPAGLSSDEKKSAIERLSKAFRAAFLNDKLTKAKQHGK